MLSDRELEVLGCLSEGQTTLQIASRLYISENTVKTHIRHILEKLEAANRTEAVSKAMQMGLDLEGRLGGFLFSAVLSPEIGAIEPHFVKGPGSLAALAQKRRGDIKITPPFYFFNP